jgi:hypothetical protein
MANEDAKKTMMEGCVVRNVYITVEVKVSRRFLISKSADETIDEMFIRLSKECRSSDGRVDCEKCRRIVKWAEECDGEVSNVISNYDRGTGSFVLDVCIDFKEHTDSEKFCKEVVAKVHDGIE